MYSAFGTVVPQDLWDAMEEFATDALTSLPEARNISQILNPWTLQSGYPVLNVVLRGADAVITQVRESYAINSKLRFISTFSATILNQSRRIQQHYMGHTNNLYNITRSKFCKHNTKSMVAFVAKRDRY